MITKLSAIAAGGTGSMNKIETKREKLIMSFSFENDRRYLAAVEKAQMMDAEVAKAQTNLDVLMIARRETSDERSRRRHVDELLANGKMPELDKRVSDDELLEAQKKLEISSEASRIARKSIAVLAVKLSLEMAPKIRQEYVRILKRLWAVVREAAKISDEEIAFRDELKAAGISVSLVVDACPLRGLGTLTDENSRVSFWRKELIEAGYISNNGNNE